MNDIFSQLIEFNQLYKELDRLYHNYAKDCGLSDSILWILYSIYESKGIYTQKNLCELWSYNKQTVNSALKNLEANGFITLEAIPDNRKNKQIILTDSGNELIEQFIKPLMEAEQNSFRKMDNNERNEFLRVTKKYIDLLQAEISDL